MKYFGFSLVSFSCILLLAIFQNCTEADVVTQQLENKNLAQDIVFIMGEDEQDAAPYYALASEYYSTEHPALKQVTHLRSLHELRDYLTIAGEGQWKNIYIVVHGNPWTGIDMSILPEGERLDKTRLRAILGQGAFSPVPNDRLDDNSIIHLEACGLGHDPLLLHLLAQALGGEDDQQPLITASKHFISYKMAANGIHKYFSQPYFTFYETGKKPALLHLERDLKMHYPEQNVNWMQALNRPAGSPGFLPTHQQFNVPVNWTSVFMDEAEIPDFSKTNRVDEVNWVYQQEELNEQLELIGIDAAQFRWRFKPTEYLLESGERLPAVQIKGKSTVLCILQPVEVEKPKSQHAENDIASQFSTDDYGFSSLAHLIAE